MTVAELIDRTEPYAGCWRDWILENPKLIGSPRADWDHRPVEDGLVEEGVHRCRLLFGAPDTESEITTIPLHAEPIQPVDGPRRRVTRDLFLPVEDYIWDLDVLQALGINHPRDLAGFLNGNGPTLNADVAIWLEQHLGEDINMLGEISRVRRIAP